MASLDEAIAVFVTGPTEKERDTFNAQYHVLCNNYSNSCKVIMASAIKLIKCLT